MLELFLILAIASVVIVVWLAGALIAAVFLTLCTALLTAAGIAFVMASDPSGAGVPIVVLLAAVLLIVVWAPQLYRRHPPARGHPYRG